MSCKIKSTKSNTKTIKLLDKSQIKKKKKKARRRGDPKLRRTCNIAKENKNKYAKLSTR